MIPIQTIGTISKDGVLTVKLPVSKVSPGEQSIIIILDDKKISSLSKKKFHLSTYPAGINLDTTFRREELYNDNGR